MQESVLHQATPQEKSAIESMAEYYKSSQQLKKVDKLLIVYYVYNKNNERFLTNLHSLGAAILSKQVKLNAKVEDDPNDDDAKIRSYENTILDIQSASIKVDEIKVSDSRQKQSFKNIRIYESQSQSLRVVTLPIDKTLIDISQINQIKAKIDAFDNKNYQIRKGLKNQKLANFQRECEVEKKQMQEDERLKMAPKHERIFNIQALLHVIRQKANKISICGLTTAKQFSNNPKEYEKDINNLFNIPAEARQLIVHTVMNLGSVESLKQKRQVSCIFTFKGKDISCPKNQCFKDEYYTKQPLTVSTKIYSLMNEAKNQFIATIIQQFCKVWSNITSATCTCIAAVVKRVYEELEYGDDSSSSLISLSKIDSSKDLGKDLKLTTYYTFQEAFYKYGIGENRKLNNNRKAQLQQFYNQERLGKVILEKGQKIAESIQLISFIHFFQKINQEFLRKYAQQQKKDYKQLFKFVLQHLKTVYELVNTINDTFAKKDSRTPSVRCQNMQAYYEFIEFLFESSKRIRSITGRQLSICGSVKALFDQLKPKQNRLITYILSRPQNIVQDQPIHYYDLYLKIIKENSRSITNKIDYIYLLIHQLKADKISKEYSYNKQRAVQAIKSYSQIIHQYPKLPEGKKLDIKRLEIQKKIARLLLVVGLPEEAVLIYQKNHLVKSVQKCFKQILMGLQGDSKSKKYIEFGLYFQKQFSYFRAIDYYESAYEVAKTKEMRQQSLKHKMQCLGSMYNQKVESTKNYTRYINNQCTQDQFFNQTNEEQNTGETSIFTRLRNKLKWEQATGASIINEGNPVEESMIE